MKHLSWLPIDLPKINFNDKIIEDFTNDFIPETAQAFQAQRLTSHAPDYGVAEWRSDLTINQQRLAEYINDHLPFDRLVNIKVHHPRRKGNTHIDFASPDKNLELYNHNAAHEPCGYRFVLNGNRQGDLCTHTASGIVYPTLPDDTDWYVVGHTNVPHSITHDCPDRYIVFCHAWINKEKHDKLLQQSLEKYRDFAVWNVTS
jgi:hypothetical protein